MWFDHVIVSVRIVRMAFSTYALLMRHIETEKNIHILTLTVFTWDLKLSLPEMQFRFAIIKILFRLVFRNFVLKF